MFSLCILSGSIRLGRFTPKVAEFVKKQLLDNKKVREVNILDLAGYKFPVMEERIGLNPNPPDHLDEFSEFLKNSDAIIFISPEYNGSFSGALKNTIDYFKKEFRRKPIGVVTVSAGMYGGINAYHDLQKLILALRAFPVPGKLLIANVEDFLKENNIIKLKKSAKSFIDELLWLTEAVFRMNNPGENKYYYN